MAADIKDRKQPCSQVVFGRFARMGRKATGLTKLTIENVVFYHERDEAAFFAWLDTMAVVDAFEGRGPALHVRLAREPTDDDLRELLAFHRRYGIEMRQLAAFRRAENETWFAATDTYWHEAVFGSAWG